MEINFQYFLFVLIRIASFIWISPGFSFRGMPQVAKLVLSFALSLSVYSTNLVVSEPYSIGMFALVLIKEMLIGVTIGYVTQLFFSGIETAGNFVDFQVGFSMSTAYDPNLGIHTSYFGRVYYWIAMIIFFLTDIHHQVIRTLMHSFELVPPGQLTIPNFAIEGIIHLFSYVFEIALNLAFPLIVVALLAEVVLALLSRTVPQINVLILGIPLKILISIIFLYLFLPILFDNIADVFPEMLQYIQDFIQSIAN